MHFERRFYEDTDNLQSYTVFSEIDTRSLLLTRVIQMSYLRTNRGSYRVGRRKRGGQGEVVKAATCFMSATQASAITVCLIDTDYQSTCLAIPATYALHVVVCGGRCVDLFCFKPNDH